MQALDFIHALFLELPVNLANAVVELISVMRTVYPIGEEGRRESTSAHLCKKREVMSQRNPTAFEAAFRGDHPPQTCPGG